MAGLGSKPIEPTYVEKMNDLAHAIDTIFNGKDTKKKETGFILMVFPFTGHEGRCNYISNAQREDVITLLKEQLAYFQGQPENIKGTA